MLPASTSIALASAGNTRSIRAESTSSLGMKSKGPLPGTVRKVRESSIGTQSSPLGLPSKQAHVGSTASQAKLART